jgi:hypothetical protein
MARYHTRAVLCEVTGAINNRIDDAYRTKYAASSYVGAMVAPRARGATMRIDPREADG